MKYRLNPSLLLEPFISLPILSMQSGDKLGCTKRVDLAGAGCLFRRKPVLGYFGQGKGAEMSYSVSDMFFDLFRGSVGETSTILNYWGVYSDLSKIASWRIIGEFARAGLVMDLS